eukprot:7383241-Prymnesium_polylepis.2
MEVGSGCIAGSVRWGWQAHASDARPRCTCVAQWRKARVLAEGCPKKLSEHCISGSVLRVTRLHPRKTRP